MIQSKLHNLILKKCDAVSAWYADKSSRLAFPFYTSFDVRDSGEMIAPVDANIYPAGFNNICPADKEHAADVARSYLRAHYGEFPGPIGLITEEHTANPFYWENVATIRETLEAAGYEVLLAVPRDLSAPLSVTSSSGKSMQVYSAQRKGSQIEINGLAPQLFISNNDFSEAYEDWARGLEVALNPPREMGWYRRKKHIFFETYNQLADEFANLIGADPAAMQVETELFTDFDVNSDESRSALAGKVDEILARLKKKYATVGISHEPFVFVKNNAGTYGLAVIKVKSGEEIRSWNYKSRKKMKAAKGGRDVEEVIIQEGIPTSVQQDNVTAEPCIYMIGCELVGGFLRTHAEKGIDDSLNSPGAVYRKLCMADLEIKQPDCPQENVYGWTAKLGVLAVAAEAEKIGAHFLNYKITGCNKS